MFSLSTRMKLPAIMAVAFIVVCLFAATATAAPMAEDLTVLYIQEYSTGALRVVVVDSMALGAMHDLPPLPTENWRVRAVGDVSGNGNPDLILQNLLGTLRVRYMDNLAQVGEEALTPEFTNANIQVVDIYNGDLFFQNVVWGGRFVWKMNQAVRVEGYRLDPVNVSWSITAVEDMGSDGSANFIFEKAAGQRNYWVLNADYFKVSGDNFTWTSADWSIMTAYDINDSGQPDLVLQHTDGRVAVWVMNGMVQDVVESKVVGILPAGWTVVGAGELYGPAAADQVVTGVEALADINVDFGTARVDLPLSGNVGVFVDGSAVATSTPVTWDNGNPAYDGNTPGEYDFTGTLLLPAGVTNPDGYNAEVKVIVADPLADALEVVSVEAIDRSTIEATLVGGTDAVEAELVTNYDVTVGGVDVDVTAAAYDVTSTVATLTVDLTGLSGECIVNGVSAPVDVPPIPVFESIDTIDGEEVVVMNFNTEVYDMAGTLGAAGDFNVTTDGVANAFVSVTAAAAAADAETTIALELTNPAAGGTVTAVQLTAPGAAKVANIWGEAAGAANRSELTVVDDVAPLFTGARFVEGGYTISLDFSEPVHSDNQPIIADQGDATDWIRVAVNGVRVAATANVQIDRPDRTANIEMDLDLSTGNLLSAGDAVVVTLDADLLDDGVANRLRDNVGNTLAGERVRTAVMIAGPGLIDVESSPLFLSNESVQTFTFTLDGVLEDTEQVWIDVSDANPPFLAAYNAAALAGDLNVDHADLNVVYNMFDDRFELTATAEIPDETEVTVTVGPFDTTAGLPGQIVTVIYQRRDVGTIAQDTFNVRPGLSFLMVANLESGRIDQDMGGNAISFELEGGLVAGQTVTINLSALTAAGVDFSRVDDAATQAIIVLALPFDFAMTGSVITLTATADIATGSVVNIDFRDDTNALAIIDVNPGATGDDYTVTFVRSDSPYVGEFDAEIEANIIAATATNLKSSFEPGAANQVQDFTFTVDGDLAQNELIDITIFFNPLDITYSAVLGTYNVTGANAEVISRTVIGGVSTTIQVRANAPIASGTVITVTAGSVSTSGGGADGQTIGFSIVRLDTGNGDNTATFDVLP